MSTIIALGVYLEQSVHSDERTKFRRQVMQDDPIACYCELGLVPADGHVCYFDVGLLGATDQEDLLLAEVKHVDGLLLDLAGGHF